MSAIVAAPGGFLGLERVARRLVAEDGFADREAALRAVAEYERFFRLAAEDRGEVFVPSRRVDLVWRRHMLDTSAYAEDCRRWAGGYLHRDLGPPAGGYERTLARLRPIDPDAWDGPGPAFVAAEGPDAAVVAQARSGLDREDLSGLVTRVRDALREAPSHAAWIVEALDLLETDPELAVREYRRFLTLLIDGAGPVAPCKLVDEFWHQHILDSRTYARFCDRVAGRPLHHAPSYEKPHGFHEPAFRRTLALYRRRNGAEPPARIWAHMGESGGGDGGSSGGSPLYEISTPDRVRAKLGIGRVDRRFQALHPVLAGRGVTPDLWADFLHDLDAVPLISWDDFAARRGNSPRAWGVVQLAALGLFALASATGPSDPRTARPAIEAVRLLLTLPATITFGAAPLVYMLRYASRPIDEARLDAVLSRYGPLLNKYGVQVDRVGDERSITIEAALTGEDLRRLADLEELRRQEDAHERAEAGAQRKKERDAYYLDRGVAPGPLAWYRLLPDWLQATLLGLAVGLPLALGAAVGWALLRSN
ncbi:hypothetical protein [Paludisphaera soli]|uniref:hypothetical protein n=1 Tax=Paludisphaera soli TaxID=2712865 RepID=UPI0013ECD001|nr:hypothetical protein [Paludisphaera soli]